ncbi:alpha/beta hydrolase [Paracoccus alkanivorans]|uniref:Alpha/beta hydrolase n=2 Tax=Paracoccus alkanivorans TaxID=2116655 RepID=A0A3M0LWR6_9RHOB|nr:alpha/beta hydrolase [Paracoccus alkanivorans]
MYKRGKTTIFACKADPRFSYCLYVPEDLDTAGQPDLVVAVHGTARMQFQYREAFAEFGRYNNAVVLAPLFPVGVRGDDDADGYKYILEGDIRYDQVLLSMVAEVEVMLDCRFPPFLMFGFSGGGHFTHRFLILHPDKLKAVSIGAPGSVTLLDSSRDWWVGIRNLRELFGRDLDVEALRRVKVHLAVGAADVETWEIQHQVGSKRYMEGANDAGRTRIERNNSLKTSLEQHGITVMQDIVPGVAHSMHGVLPYTMRFFRGIVQPRERLAAQ